MRGDWKESEQQLKAALAIEPAAAATHATLGNVYVSTGEIALARSEFEKALSADPNYLPARDALARLAKAAQ